MPIHTLKYTMRLTLTFVCIVFVRAGVSKTVTVDVKGSWQRWLKVRDLIKGATYMFGVQALTVSYGPPIQANITAQPVQGKQGRTSVCVCVNSHLGRKNWHTQ